AACGPRPLGGGGAVSPGGLVLRVARVAPELGAEPHFPFPRAQPAAHGARGKGSAEGAAVAGKLVGGCPDLRRDRAGERELKRCCSNRAPCGTVFNPCGSCRQMRIFL